MQIQVVSVSKPEWKEKGKAKWQELILTYTSGGKTTPRKFMSFSPVFNKIKEMESNEVYEVEMTKNEQTGYWDWISITKGQEAAPDAPAKHMSRPSTYETAEERAQKQIYIVRQSCLSIAQQLLAANGGKKNTADEVIDIADTLFKYVFNGKDAVGMEGLMQMEDDIPQ